MLKRQRLDFFSVYDNIKVGYSMNKFKKILFITPIIAALLYPLFATPSVFAEDCKGKTGDEYTKCMAIKGNQDSSCRNFLGLTSWDCNVNITNEETLKSGIWQIAANVATDITVLAAYLVLGFVIYGGYLYILSSGDPNKVATGKKTLIQAFIGLAIVMLAYVILNAIRIALIGTDSFATCDLSTGSNCANANDLVTTSIQWVIGIAGVVAVIFVVYGGISYATSSGDSNKLQKAKQTILYALIGLVIVGLAELITAFVSGIIRDAKPADTESFINQTTIVKELNEIKTT